MQEDLMGGLIGNRRALDWANAFSSEFEVTQKNTKNPVEDTCGLMLAWFAAAIESGYGIGRDAEANNEPTEGKT